NAYYFFTLYANADRVRARLRSDSEHLLDRYVLGKTRELVLDVQREMDGYDIAAACQRITAFLDAMNNWYIRRSRPRFWGDLGADEQRDAYDTLYTVLVTLTKVAAPLLPLLTEEVYRGLTSERSVHLSDWPDVAAWPDHAELVRDVDRVRDVCSAGLALRESQRIRTRLPLRSLTIAGEGAAKLARYADLIRDELNVKNVEVAAEMTAFGSFQMVPNAPKLGPKLGADMKKVMAAARSGDWTLSGDAAV